MDFWISPAAVSWRWKSQPPPSDGFWAGRPVVARLSGGISETNDVSIIHVTNYGFAPSTERLPLYLIDVQRTGTQPVRAEFRLW